jgi:hypothetical protein
MRMRLIYNGAELTSDTGVPLSHITIANGLPDPDEASLRYNTISIVIVKPGRRVGRVSALRHA